MEEVTHKSTINDVINSEDITRRLNIDLTKDSEDKISFSIANELEKLSKLKNENIISEEEFQMLKNKLFQKDG